MKIACIGECMVELTLPREAGGATRVGFAGDTFNAAVYLKRSAPEVDGGLRHRGRRRRAVGRDGRGLRGGRARHQPRRAAAGQGARALRDQRRREGRAELHLLARERRGADAVPAAGDGDARPARRVRPRLPVGDHRRDPVGGGPGGAARLPAGVSRRRRAGRLRLRTTARGCGPRRRRPSARSRPSGG